MRVPTGAFVARRNGKVFVTGNSGFPKSHDVSKGIDKKAGHWRGRAGAAHEDDDKRSFGQHYECNEKGEPITDAVKQWEGWGSALKPAHEPIVLARKPLIGTIVENVLEHGTGAINIDACRVETEDGGRPKREVHDLRDDVEYHGNALAGRVDGSLRSSKAVGTTDQGRWPANVVHSGDDEVEAEFAKYGKRKSAGLYPSDSEGTGGGVTYMPKKKQGKLYEDSGTASRFYYCAKASKKERGDSRHPTVKPVALIRWLVRLVTPPGGVVLDCFAGSGTTGEAAILEGHKVVLIEREAEYVEDIRNRLQGVECDPPPVRQRTRRN